MGTKTTLNEIGETLAFIVERMATKSHPASKMREAIIQIRALLTRNPRVLHPKSVLPQTVKSASPRNLPIPTPVNVCHLQTLVALSQLAARINAHRH